jgi:hypothetical protein
MRSGQDASRFPHAHHDQIGLLAAGHLEDLCAGVTESNQGLRIALTRIRMPNEFMETMECLGHRQVGKLV